MNERNVLRVTAHQLCRGMHFYLFVCVCVCARVRLCTCVRMCVFVFGVCLCLCLLYCVRVPRVLLARMCAPPTSMHAAVYFATHTQLPLHQRRQPAAGRRCRALRDTGLGRARIVRRRRRRRHRRRRRCRCYRMLRVERL